MIFGSGWGVIWGILNTFVCNLVSTDPILVLCVLVFTQLVVLYLSYFIDLCVFLGVSHATVGAPYLDGATVFRVGKYGVCSPGGWGGGLFLRSV